MKIPFLRSVVPPHVFCLLDEGVTYARVREGSPSGFEESRHFRYPAGPFEAGAHVRLTREALSEAVSKNAVSVAPGHRAVTRTPVPRVSAHNASVNESTYALVAP